MRPTLYATLGLPASGKTTRAKEMLKKRPNTIKRVNKDDLRKMIDNGYWNGKKTEKYIEKARNELVALFLIQGFDVIVDDTNFGKHIEQLRQLAKENACDFIVIDMTDVTLDECLKRDANRANPVGASVIKRMYYQYLHKPAKIEYDPNLPDCYIFDIDGTLAINNGHRGFFEWNKVGGDEPNFPVINMHRTLEREMHGGQTIFIFSGRDSVCREETIAWLEDNGINSDNLFMRPEGSMEKDTIVKERMYRENIEGKYNVLGIFDDRPCVIRMWQSLGLPVFNVGDEGREF